MEKRSKSVQNKSYRLRRTPIKKNPENSNLNRTTIISPLQTSKKSTFRRKNPLQFALPAKIWRTNTTISNNTKIQETNFYKGPLHKNCIHQTYNKNLVKFQNESSQNFLKNIRPRSNTVIDKPDQQENSEICENSEHYINPLKHRCRIKQPLIHNVFIGICEQIASQSINTLIKSFILNQKLPELLDKRYNYILGDDLKNTHSVLNIEMFQKIIREYAIGDTISKRIYEILENKFASGKLTYLEFANFLIKNLIGSDTFEDQLKFGFEFYDINSKEYLDCIVINYWMQSDAEQILRYDLLAISEMIKIFVNFGKNIRKNTNIASEKFTKTIILSDWSDLGLWGHACSKKSPKFHSRNQTIISLKKQKSENPQKKRINFETNLYENFIEIPRSEQLNFKQFKKVKFGNCRCIPDIVFLMIYAIYGEEIGDLYCNFMQIKLFRIFRLETKEKRLILKRIYDISPGFLEKCKEELFFKMNASKFTKNIQDFIKESSAILYIKIMDRGISKFPITSESFFEYSVFFSLV